MKKLALAVAVVVFSAASIGAFAGRTGDQWMLQEQQNQRVVAEKQTVSEMQAMLVACYRTHSSR